MARKTKLVTVGDEGGRDKGKIFLITELSAFDGEDWTLRALRLAQRAGTDVPGGIQGGMAAVAAIGIMTILSSATDIDELRPLFADMMACVQIMTDPKTQHVRKLIDRGANAQGGVNEDIEESGTRLLLRKEWLDLHLNFSVAEAISTLISASKPPAS